MSFFSLIILIYIVIAIAKSVKAAKDRDTTGGTTVGGSQRKTPWDASRGSYQAPVYTSKGTTQPTTYAASTSKQGTTQPAAYAASTSKQGATQPTAYAASTSKQGTTSSTTYKSAIQKAASYGSTSTSTYQKSDTAPKAEIKQGAEQSTVDYLAQKAEQEQETQDRVAKISASSQKDGHRVAVRLFEGDLPPAGTRVIKCNYCGAENLIPQNATGQFACYFCREDL